MVVSIHDIVEAENLVKVLEDSLDMIPILIFIMKSVISIGRRELRSEGLEHLIDTVAVVETVVTQSD